MGTTDDTRFLRAELGWSAEIQRLAALAERDVAAPDEVARAGKAALRLIPPGESFSRHHAAVARLIASSTTEGAHRNRPPRELPSTFAPSSGLREPASHRGTPPG